MSKPVFITLAITAWAFIALIIRDGVLVRFYDETPIIGGYELHLYATIELKHASQFATFPNMCHSVIDSLAVEQ